MENDDDEIMDDVHLHRALAVWQRHAWAARAIILCLCAVIFWEIIYG